jgi:hypothetical protein
MTLRQFGRTTIVLATLTLPAAATAAAQGAAPPAAPPAAAPVPAMPKAAALEVEHHIAELHTQLAITPAEQPQWDQFAKVMRDNAAQMGATLDGRGGQMAHMNAVENMQSYATLAQLHAENMKRLTASFGTLYGALSDDQKHLADTVFRNDQPHHGSAHRHVG